MKETIAAIVHKYSGLDSLTWEQLHEDFKKPYREAAKEIIEAMKNKERQ